MVLNVSIDVSHGHHSTMSLDNDQDNWKKVYVTSRQIENWRLLVVGSGSSVEISISGGCNFMFLESTNAYF
jgi:hypothetical protein